MGLLSELPGRNVGVDRLGDRDVVFVWVDLRSVDRGEPGSTRHRSSPLVSPEVRELSSGTPSSYSAALLILLGIGLNSGGRTSV